MLKFCKKIVKYEDRGPPRFACDPNDPLKRICSKPQGPPPPPAPGFLNNVLLCFAHIKRSIVAIFISFRKSSHGPETYTFYKF
jgi:hypothetical protein